MTEKEMKSHLSGLEASFEKYREEVVRLEAITDAFESQCRSIGARNDLLEELARKTKLLIENKDYERLSALYKGMVI